MRPIYWGLVFFLIGIIGFVGVSIYYDIITLENALIYIFGAIAVCSLPTAVVVEVIKWRKRKEEKELKEKK